MSRTPYLALYLLKKLCMLENCSQEALIGKVRISVSLSIELLEAGGESLEKNEAVDKSIKLDL